MAPSSPDPIDLPADFGAGPLRLRPPTHDDAPRITEICRDPAIGHHTTVPVPYTRSDAHAFVDFAVESLKHGTAAHLVVEEDGEVVAAVGLDINHVDRAGRVGFWVAPEARGRGVATRMLRQLCAWALDDDGLGLARLELDTAADNPASNTVARRLGFTHEGTRRSAVLLSGTEGFPEERADVNDWGLLPGELR